ncbi:MAG: hypothetical protein P8046_01550 [Anaerolineales bacterium]
MKYEEWIQYERKRLSQPNPNTWISLEPAVFTPQPASEEKPRVWTLIVQVFNSQRI